MVTQVIAGSVDTQVTVAYQDILENQVTPEFQVTVESVVTLEVE